MQIAFYKSANQLAVFLNDKEARRLDPRGTGGFRAEVVPTGHPSTFKITLIPDDNGNPLRQLNSGWYSAAWTVKSTRQSGVNLLSPRSQAAPNVGSEAWGPNGEFSCEITYTAAGSSLPALVATPTGGSSVTSLKSSVINNTDDLGAVLAQMKAHDIKGRVTAITVEVI